MSRGPSVLGVPAMPDADLRAGVHLRARFIASLESHQRHVFYATERFQSACAAESLEIGSRAGLLMGASAFGGAAAALKLLWVVTS